MRDLNVEAVAGLRQVARDDGRWALEDDLQNALDRQRRHDTRRANLAPEAAIGLQIRFQFRPSCGQNQADVGAGERDQARADGEAQDRRGCDRTRDTIETMFVSKTPRSCCA